MRRLIPLLAGLVLVVPVLPGTIGFADDAADRAAREIADARERANAAADALFQAESELDRLEVEQQQLRQDIATLEAQISDLQATVEAIAVNRFTRSGTSSLPLLTGFESVGDQAQVQALIEVVNEASAEDFDVYDAVSIDLAAAQARLERNEREAEVARDSLEQRKADALAEIERLKQIEEQRLKDEAVRKAVAALEAERRRQADEQAAREAAALVAANSAGQPARGGGGGSAPVAPAPAPAPAPDEGSGGSDGGEATPPAGESGGSGGGQTGGGGSGGRPSGGGRDWGSPGWLCPVQGFIGFADTWGAPRSGGRTHQGVDLIGARGLPLVAVVDGFVQQKVNRLGGNSVWLSGVDGNKYYYAHLDSWAAAGSVTAGTVIGTLGDTGNAKYSVPHLHFEIHPGGGAAVNPYPTVRAHC
jgi:murein DD-endopeptidase MepM/ murein hydrolase activator NlpD